MSRHLTALTALAALSAPPAAAQDQADDTADSLITLWIDSAGGMKTYRQFQSASYTVTTILYDTLTGNVRRERPRYVWIKKGPYGEETRVERQEPYGFVEQGFNGRVTWATVDGKALPDTAKDAREALYVARDLFYWIGLPFKLRDPGVHLRYLGRIQRPGARLSTDGSPGEEDTRHFHAVAVSFGEGVGEHQDVFTYYFLPGHGFPTEVTYVEEGRTALDRLTWGATGRFGAISYPIILRRDWLTASGKRTKTLEISDAVINPDIPQRRFDKR